MKRFLITFFALATIVVAQQGNLSLTVGLGPSGFGTTSTTTCGLTTLTSLNHVVRTEPLIITLQSSPTHVNPPPLIPVPRRVALFIGVQDCSGFVSFGGSFVFISLMATPPPVAIFDSFSNAFDPVFGPPVLGPSFINFVVGADLFGPYGGINLPPLVLQAITEDLPNTATPFLVSNPVEMNVIDPQTGGFAPTVGLIASSSGACAPGGGPGGPETGGTTITLTGTNFPVHTNWMQYPPTVMVGTTPATGVVILSPTTATAVTQAPFPPTCPPSTPAGPKNVTFTNHSLISPSAVPFASQTKFTYCSGRTPVAMSLDLSDALPQGGETLHIFGTDFLYGADVILTSQAAANLNTTISPPDPSIIATGATCAAPTPTRITVTTPPFCAGGVSVKVVNPDGVPTGTLTLSYGSHTAHATTVLPAATVPGLVIPANLGVMSAAGSPVNVFGSDFISSSNPLFNAPTVSQNPGTLYPSRTEILDPTGTVLYTSPPGASGVTASNAISLTPAIAPPTGAFRPTLGVKWLRVVNCPCVDTSPVMAPPAYSVPILIQDAAGPGIMSFFPNLITPAGPGGAISSKITITGSNFFARTPTQSFPVIHTFPTTNPSTPLLLEDLVVPAVSFGGVFSPEVELVSPTELRAKIPEGIASQSAVTVQVYNPDGQSTTAPNSLMLVPRLTDPTQMTPNDPGQGLPPLMDLDVTTLLAITIPDTNPFRIDEAILFYPNPTASDDRLEDIANGGDPAVTSNPAAYDGIFVFNTRTKETPPAVHGGMRCFDFRRIDVPATFVLPAPINIGGIVIQAGIKRVIFKATSFYVESNFSTKFYVDENFPFVLRSHDDFTFSGLLDVSGDTVVSQNVASSPTQKFHLRCEWQLPPAGGGIGGRGGMHTINPLSDLDTSATSELLVIPIIASTLTQPNLGTPASQLNALPGYPPRTRHPVYPAAEPLTFGHYGLGRAPVGGLAGGGGGGGFALAGAPGQAGATVSPAGAGVAFGNQTNLPATTPGRPNLGDAYIYGSSTAPADFAGPLGLAAPAFPFGLFSGGSGGGGGGGSLAIVVPCVSLGGRGGNGGGSVVLLSDRIFKLGTYGRIFADGEKGQLGIDAFPIANGEPIFVLCAPGSGGGGAGGSIFIAAVVDVDLTAPVVSLNQRMLSADGGLGGAPTGTTTVTTAHGGAGGPGRIRVAINQHSQVVGQRRSEFGGYTTLSNVSPNPGNNLPIDFFQYPSP